MRGEESGDEESFRLSSSVSRHVDHVEEDSQLTSTSTIIASHSPINPLTFS
jgi:hypothetical protein